MRIILSILLLSLSLQSNSQNVLSRDSSVVSYNNRAFIQAESFAYTYDNKCRVISKKSPTSETLYTYNTDGRLYQSTFLLFDASLNIYVNSSRNIRTYNITGKITDIVYQAWNADSSAFINVGKDSSLYDQNNFLIKEFGQDWIASSNTWQTASEFDLYNNSSGKPDSSLEQILFLNYATKSYYSYYTNSGKLYQERDSAIVFNDNRSILLRSFFYDTSNYKERDSIVFESDNYDTAFITEIFVNTTLYNTDNTKKKYDAFIDIESEDSTSLNKTYYFYAPCTSVLSVALFSFTGAQQKNNIFLQWKTTNEVNASYYVLQRSIDGENFKTISNITAQLNGSMEKNYSYTDVNVCLFGSPKIYYRLGETDRDGSIKYGSVIAVNITPASTSFYIFPNPVSNNINLYANESISNASIFITDIKGRIVYSAIRKIDAGNSINIDATFFAKGEYILTVQASGLKQQLMFIR